MSLLALRTAIVTQITTDFGTSLKTCQAHGGKFNLDELMRWSVRAPAVLVAVLGGPVDREGGANVVNAKVVAFVITQGTSVVHRDAAALLLVDQLVAMACNDAWDYEKAQAPMGIATENLYSGEIDQKGVALWAVTWSQRCDVGEVDSSGWDDFRTLYAQWDLTTADGVMEAEDNIEPQGGLMEAYANLHVNVPGMNTAFTGPGTWDKLRADTLVDESSGFAATFSNELQYTGTQRRKFMVKAAVSLTTAGAGVLSLAIAKNGVVDTDTAVSQTVDTGQKYVFAVQGMVELTTNGYVELYASHSTGANVTATKVRLTAVSV